MEWDPPTQKQAMGLIDLNVSFGHKTPWLQPPGWCLTNPPVTTAYISQHMKFAVTLLLMGLVCPPSTYLQPFGPQFQLCTRSWKVLYVPGMSLFFQSSVFVNPGLLGLKSQPCQVYCLLILLLCLYPWQKQLKGKGFALAHSLRVESTAAGKVWWQELEAAGHTVPTVRK